MAEECCSCCYHEKASPDHTFVQNFYQETNFEIFSSVTLTEFSKGKADIRIVPARFISSFCPTTVYKIRFFWKSGLCILLYQKNYINIDEKRPGGINGAAAGHILKNQWDQNKRFPRELRHILEKTKRRLCVKRRWAPPLFSVSVIFIGRARGHLNKFE